VWNTRRSICARRAATSCSIVINTRSPPYAPQPQKPVWIVVARSSDASFAARKPEYAVLRMNSRSSER
jgi:hypothetical protein